MDLAQLPRGLGLPCREPVGVLIHMREFMQSEKNSRLSRG
jgi:hypothetical protein